MSNPLRLPVPLQNWSLEMLDDPPYVAKVLILRGPSLSNTQQVTALQLARSDSGHLDSLVQQGVAVIQQKAITEFGLQSIIDERIRQAQLALLNKVMMATYKRVDASMSIADASEAVRQVWEQKAQELA